MPNEDLPILIGFLSDVSTENLVGTLTDPSDFGLNGELTIPEYSQEHYELPPATRSTLGGIIVGENLLITEEGVLSVDTANDAEQDNTRPITAAAVYTEIGNIDVLLSTI